MTTHTPGPWTIIEKPHGFSIEPSVCWMGNSSEHQKHENRANAKLIAAAPDLLEALRECVHHLVSITGCDSRPNSDSAEVVGNARQAIAKVTGEQDASR